MRKTSSLPGRLRDGDDAAGFAAVLLGGELVFDVFEDEFERQVVLCVLGREGLVRGELVLQVVQRLVEGLPGGAVVRVCVGVVQGGAQVLEPVLCRGVFGL